MGQLPLMGAGPTGAGGPWYLAGGVAAANCIAAYQPKGAASLAASYVNLANPGTYNAAPGVAPTFDAATGWTFNGSTQYLTTGVVVASVAWSVIIKFTDWADADSGLVGVLENPGPLRALEIWQNSGASIMYANGGSASVTVPPKCAAGVLCIAGKDCYRNGVSDGTIGVGTVMPAAAQVIGGVSVFGALNYYAACKMQALAIYNTTLTGPQVAAITVAMGGL